MQTKPNKQELDAALAAWQVQVAQAKEQPWLAALMLRKGERLFRRFAWFYQQLRALPRKTRRAWQKKLATTLAGAALLLALAGPTVPITHAATIAVNPGSTGVNGSDGGCSLVEAILTANTGSYSSGDCSGGTAGADTITLAGNTYSYAADYAGSYFALPDISSQITIEANHALIQRAGGSNFAILNVGVGGSLTLNNATITGGNGFYGGGIYNKGVLTLNNSTVSGNSAALGGGIMNYGGTMTLNNSTIASNSASDPGFAGGGIFNFNGPATLNNTTVTNNNASGYSSDGGGIANLSAANLTLNRSIITGNIAIDAGKEIYNLATMTANNYNLLGDIGKPNAVAFYGFTPGANDITATSDGSNPTALSGILESVLSGGMSTSLPVPGSPALDAAPSAACASSPINGIDQRGAPRSYGSGCDIGAVELQETVQQCGLAEGSSYNFPFTGSGRQVVVEINTGGLGNLNCLWVEELRFAHPVGTAGIQFNNQWWHIWGRNSVGGPASGFNVNVTLPAAYVPDTGDQACRHAPSWITGGLTGAWDCGADSMNANSITRNNQTAFSDWAIQEDQSPTAVTLQAISASSGGRQTAVFATLSLALGGLWLRLRGRAKTL